MYNIKEFDTVECPITEYCLNSIYRSQNNFFFLSYYILSPFQGFGRTVTSLMKSSYLFPLMSLLFMLRCLMLVINKFNDTEMKVSQYINATALYVKDD